MYHNHNFSILTFKSWFSCGKYRKLEFKDHIFYINFWPMHASEFSAENKTQNFCFQVFPSVFWSMKKPFWKIRIPRVFLFSFWKPLSQSSSGNFWRARILKPGTKQVTWKLGGKLGSQVEKIFRLKSFWAQMFKNASNSYSF